LQGAVCEHGFESEPEGLTYRAELEDEDEHAPVEVERIASLERLPAAS
jgi:hypothetical protein